MASPQTIQPSNADTYIYEADKTSNYGTDQNFYIGPLTNNRARCPIKFDFSAVVPTGATITLATLSVYASSSPSGRTITAYRLLRTDWVETQATWNIYKTGNNWTTAGALSDGNDFTSTNSATASSLGSAGWLNFTVTAQVQTALDSVSGVAHFLLADIGASASGKDQTCDSREYVANTSLRPKLYIEYTEPASGPANLKSYNTNLKANIKSINTNPLANIKSLNTNI